MPGCDCVKIGLIAGYMTYNTVYQTCGHVDVWITDEENVGEGPDGWKAVTVTP